MALASDRLVQDFGSFLSSSNSQTINSNEVRFIVDNSCKRVPESRAKLDRSGRYRKVFDWTLYVDIVAGNPDLVERVVFDLGPTFQPQQFISTCPVPVKLPNGQGAWRFSTRQQVYGASSAEIYLRGAGGTKSTLISHEIKLFDGDESLQRKKRVLHSFQETRGAQALRMLKIADNAKFGIELELSSSPGVDPELIADVMPQNAGYVQVVGSWRDGRESYQDGWKIVPDGSIVCSRNMPSCHKFELVSRILVGGKGLSEVAAVCSALKNFSPMLQVNKSMGFHVHIDVSGYSLPQMIAICQNFCKYEEVMDSFMPLSRRDGSPECDTYFKSNRSSVQSSGTNQQVHVRLNSCYDVESLADCMNRDGRYYKLNLQNLVTGRQPTIEFRQHSSTLNYNKISAWVRFCASFVHNSAKMVPPKPFKRGRSLDFQMGSLFAYVIKDRALRDFYRERQNHVDHDDCCNACASGGSCNGSHLPRLNYK